MLIDLQLHSRYSDGYLTPEELAKFIAKQGVKVAALTDHNTVRGLHQFKKACEKYGVRAIPGIEIYVTLNNRHFNILWYNLNHTSTELHDMLRNSQIRRRQQMRIVLEKIKNNGFVIDINAIIDKYNHYAPVNHIVDDICAIPANLNKIKKDFKGKSFRESDIINDYFQNKKFPPVLKNSNISLERILKLRKKIGGQIIICHPAKSHFMKRDFWEKIKKLGIDGVELLSPHHSYNAIMHIQHLAREMKFIETGGSDFHRFEGSGHSIQKSWNYFLIDSDNLFGIEKIIGNN
ncbi:MAG: hypothetical protein US83_C0003G0025 [Candidatus Falkowbacteria bacterium GW2011_GWC2_38_22]|uniref:Polymerase/histidinol phosphatase N-terminal domain-containing protein n=1 Tax=Candidatus Falkowbacteria bacterium GW2011_GWE1_38_31 TaxID=1618638 RepID=A0A0G0K6X1_9BACT|nr:MAG: hypothetical protein US73_C0001G0117 [Candidatus Falkowbacteria bacterium GW2011_GWF2_38_1205]KKQ61776.1 MAG: hypothetical protein US83_C0003G0025 [Candidatus Falkowbacteria bacterium GW2011_GWC2_38_22]KKQ64084.1 MAG: hypothetical protein US84_C0002G0116 [Candidatus Falkowbacteria bacterium GW2011_GWF1_38_22]KKQ66567.1 MAG: hypothetical protein US87_C0001G0088 [Candidatus Falkowbacteria bacterium GW2011_GWE2_38_254]KKQ71190.1 MAG: hypothetical protein US91_C0001G0117 [Candidatus Falkowb